jgi:hypothetical protein
MTIDKEKVVGVAVFVLLLWLALGAYIAMALIFVLVAVVVGYLQQGRAKEQDEEV